MIEHILLLLMGVFISSVAQVLLKKSAMKQYDSFLREYINPLVILAYSMFLTSTFLSILAYREIPLSMGPVLEATSYIYITVFGVKIFKEKMNIRNFLALGFIIAGIVIYAFGS